MLVSMTGFGAARCPDGTVGGWLSAEVRSVNHRFLDVRVRMPRELQALQAAVEAATRRGFERGRVEVTVLWERSGLGATRIDDAVVRGIVADLRALADELDLEPEIRLGDILAAGELLAGEASTIDRSTLEPALLSCLDQALSACAEMRAREGAVLYREMALHRQAAGALVDRLAALAPAAVAALQERTSKRVEELLALLGGDAGKVVVDAGRVAQELALLAERCDVTEELARLRAHLEQWDLLCAGDAPTGRRLDFLAQELHREANTLGAKAQDAETAHLVVDLKGELEKLREQAQNIQ